MQTLVKITFKTAVRCLASSDTQERDPMLPKRTKSLLAAQLGRFVQQYGRKATKGWDPNDRSYDRKLEEKIKRLSPEDLSDLLSGEEVDPVPPRSKTTNED